MTLKYTALQAAPVVAIAGAAVAPTLKNLAAGANKLGDTIDLSGTDANDRDLFFDWELQVRGAVAFTAGEFVELYFIPALDGTNFADGSDTIDPQPELLAHTFTVRAVSTQQRLGVTGLPAPLVPFKPLVINQTGQAFTNTDNENVLRYRLYSIEDV